MRLVFPLRSAACMPLPGRRGTNRARRFQEVRAPSCVRRQTPRHGDVRLPPCGVRRCLSRVSRRDRQGHQWRTATAPRTMPGPYAAVEGSLRHTPGTPTTDVPARPTHGSRSGTRTVSTPPRRGPGRDGAPVDTASDCAHTPPHRQFSHTSSIQTVSSSCGGSTEHLQCSGSADPRTTPTDVEASRSPWTDPRTPRPTTNTTNAKTTTS